MSDLPPMTSPKRWLVTTNHKDVGILYLLTALFFMVAGGILALLIRVQMWSSAGGVLSGLEYNQVVTGHGLVMVFWFLSPFAFGFANYFVPLQIGAKDLAFPRLNALSYWLYLGSGLIVLASFLQGGGAFDGGWTIYAPLNLPAHTPGIGSTATLLGLLMFVISVTFGTINFLVTIHRSRAEGMSLWNLPLFTWSILLTVWMMLFAFAALLAALLLVSADRLVGSIYFATTDGSGALLWAHIWWFFGHPEVYIVFFPALGVMLEIFQTFAGRRIVGRKWVIISMILVAVQSFLVWMHHMFLTSINLEIKTLTMATTIAISLPFDLMVFALIYTLVKGSVRFKTPFLFAFGALLLFIVGGITGVFLGAVVLDYEFRGTYWVVAHFHYVMFGGATALFGAVYYWWPKITGKMYDETLGKLNFAVFFVGFNLLYFPLFVAWETPRRVYNYADWMVSWHQLSTIGAFITALSFLILFYTLAKSYRTGEDADGNPWAYTQTAEWAMPSPPPLENWSGRPSYADGTLKIVDDGGPAVTDGGTAAQASQVDHDEHHGPDHASIWPFVISAGFTLLLAALPGATGDGGAGSPGGQAHITMFNQHDIGTKLTSFDIGGLMSAASTYVDATGGIHYIGIFLAGLGIFIYGLYGFGRQSFHAPEMNIAERWPFEGVPKNKLGMWFFIASDIIVFGAILGAYVFIRTNVALTEVDAGTYSSFTTAFQESWASIAPSATPGLINTIILLTSSFLVILALVKAKQGSKRGLLASMTGVFLLGLSFLSVKAWEWWVKFNEDPAVLPWNYADHPYAIEASVFYVTTSLHALHVIMGLAVAGFMIGRVYFHDAYLGDEEAVENFGLYWHFVDLVWVFIFPMFYLM